MQDCAGEVESPIRSLECVQGGRGGAPDVDEGDAVARSGGVHAIEGLISNVRQALEQGGCDKLAGARVLNLLEQHAVNRDLENLRVLIELARSEKSLAATQQLLAASEADTLELRHKVGELEQANAALLRRVHQIRASGSTELQEQLQATMGELQQLKEDFEDKKEQCDGMMRVRNFLVDELSLANLQLQDVHALHAQSKVRMAQLQAGIDLVLSGADPEAVFHDFKSRHSSARA